MKNSILLLCCAFPLLVNAQLHENFTSAEYPHRLQWRGHPFAFHVNADSQLQSQTINTTYISTENRLAQGAVWEIGIKLRFNPSPSNQLRIYLIADNDTLTAPLNGYFIQIGEIGSTDRYHLYRQEGENTKLLLSSPPLERPDPSMIDDRIRVVRDTEGDWELQLAIGGGEFTAVGAVTDTTFTHTAFFGFHCRFTSANSDKFHFDYFSIDTTTTDIILDTLPSALKLLPDNTDNAVFYDDFSAGFPNTWLGETAAFDPVDERLKLRENGASPALVVTPSNRLNNTIWEAGIQVDAPLSSGNYVRFYLAANDTLMTDHEGYHLQIDGAKGTHVYHLWRQNGRSRSRIFQSDSIPNQDAIFRARVRVVRDSKDQWKIFADEYDNGTFEPVLRNNGDSSVVDNTNITAGYTGFYTNFSKTRWGDYAFDYLLIKPFDLQAEPIPDSIPPKIVLANFIDSTSLFIAFDKAIDPSSAPRHFSLNGQQPAVVEVVDGTATLSFLTPFENGTYALQVSDVQNLYGFAMEADTLISLRYKKPYTAQLYDVVINEIMANPNGAAGLPIVEYIELYNQSEETVSLIGWRYESLTRAHTFTDGEIAPGSYLVLGPKSDAITFEPFGNFLALSPWPPLVNDGTTLTLKNQYGTIIDEVSYHPSWSRDTKKRSGWSLERIDPQGLCLDADNWIASTDSRGGTPGGQNSVYSPDHAADFKIIHFAVQNSVQLLLTFSHSLDPVSAAATEKYQLSNGAGQPAQVQLMDSRNVVLHYENPFPTGVDYSLTIEALANCAGQPTNFRQAFFIPDEIQPNDILINEILFNPKSKGMDQVTTDGVDFVEIYNHSSSIVDLQQLYLAHVNHQGAVAGYRQISENPLLFYPAEYKVLTSQPHIVKEHYPLADQSTFILLASLPRFNNNAGTALLISGGKTIDSLAYHESMHAPFITNRKGISLERRHFGTPTNAIGNFHSAATTVGGATPGYQNSQGAEDTGQSGIYLTSKTFSPDEDGFEDVLEINYQFPTTGNMANIHIFNDRGELVRRLQSNQSMALRGTITWDGRSDTSQRLPVGIYIALIEIYNAQGSRKVYRKSFALVAKI